MNKEFNRMQKLAGLITENVENTNKDLKDLEDMLKKHDWTYKMSDDSSNFSKGSRQEDEINKLVDLLGDEGKKLKDKYDPFKKAKEMGMEEGVAAYEYEKGKKAGEMGMEEGLKRTIRESQKQKSLREKIREMILAEMDGAAVEAEDYDPVAEAKKDKEEEVEDIDIDVTDEKMVGNDNPKVAEIQDLLNQLQDAAEELGDEKLLIQIGNTITFFTREHVATADNMG
jgi:hypothetical protein